MYGGIVVAGVEGVAVGVVFGNAFIKRIFGAEDGVARYVVQQVFYTGKHLDAFCKVFGKLNVHDTKPGRTRRAEIVRHYRQVHGAGNFTGIIYTETNFTKGIANSIVGGKLRRMHLRCAYVVFYLVHLHISSAQQHLKPVGKIKIEVTRCTGANGIAFQVIVNYFACVGGIVGHNFVGKVGVKAAYIYTHKPMLMLYGGSVVDVTVPALFGFQFFGNNHFTRTGKCGMVFGKQVYYPKPVAPA